MGNKLKFFYEEGYYNWMEEQISDFKNILEIGGGTGYSTLSLLEKGHKVFVIENNPFCIQKSIINIENHGYIVGNNLDDNSDVIFIQYDLLEDNIEGVLKNIDYDIIVCWNIGTDWNKLKQSKYKHIFEKYNCNQSSEELGYENNYSEMITRRVAQIAMYKEKPLHLIERSHTNGALDSEYFEDIARVFRFNKIKYNDKWIVSISGNGVRLTYNSKELDDDYVKLALNSIIFLRKY